MCPELPVFFPQTPPREPSLPFTPNENRHRNETTEDEPRRCHGGVRSDFLSGKHWRTLPPKVEQFHGGGNARPCEALPSTCGHRGMGRAAEHLPRSHVTKQRVSVAGTRRGRVGLGLRLTIAGRFPCDFCTDGRGGGGDAIRTAAAAFVIVTRLWHSRFPRRRV